MAEVEPGNTDLPPTREREIFRELVSFQDSGMSVEQSRQRLVDSFDVPLQIVKDVEARGIAQGWPPLD